MALGGTNDADEPIQPVFQKYMASKREILFYRSSDGKLVLIESGGPEGTAIANDDEGRTWRKWPEIKDGKCRMKHQTKASRSLDHDRG